MKVEQAVMVLCYKISHKYKELLPFLLYLMITSIYYENVKLPLEREGSIRFYVCSKISKREGNNEKLLPKRVSAQAVIFHYYRSA